MQFQQLSPGTSQEEMTFDSEKQPVMPSPSTPQQQEEMPEQRRARAEASPEQRYERGLPQQHFTGAQFSQQPYAGGWPPEPRGYRAPQPPVVVQNFYQTPAPASMQPAVVVNVVSSQNVLLRALWFIFIGWWMGLIWLHIGFVLCATVIFLPVGLLMLNRLPTVLTLQSTRPQTTVTTYQNGMVAVRVGEPQQLDFLLRALYFLVIGWWLGYVWALVGYIFCFTIILMPIGLMMLGRLPTILTLRQM